MKRKGKTSQRTILFRQNVNRDNEEWAHFLEGYRKWLMDWDMLEFGDDWHTAEDIVSEIFLGIILEPLITNLRPDDSFRHTLIVLCKHAHRDLTKPWRKGLVEKLCGALRLTRRTRSDALLDSALGLIDFVEADLMDKTRDGTRAFKTFSKEDLKRWRMLRKAEAREKAKEKAKTKVKAKDVAKKNKIAPSTFSKSCKKVNEYTVDYVKEIMRRRGIR